MTNHVELLHSKPHGLEVMINLGRRRQGYTHDSWRSETSGEPSEIFGEWFGSRRATAKARKEKLMARLPTQLFHVIL